MKFSPSSCPKCGHAAVSVLESVLVEFSLEEVEPGLFDYDGDKEIDYDSSEFTKDASDNVTLRCGCSHTWQAALTDSETDFS